MPFDFQSQADRADMYRRIRSFFDGRGYLEVFTPTLSPTLIPEPTIQDFSTRFVNEFLSSRDFYLVPSPEIFMKEILASGSPSIYQISQCFRNCEQLGRIHNPEFSMLEYYTLGYDEKDSIGLTEELVRHLICDKSPSWLSKPFRVLSVREAVMDACAFDLDDYQEPGALIDKARSLGETPSDDEAWDDVFNRIFISHVETGLADDEVVVFTDYPVQIECLAKAYDDAPYRHRWEMYMGGIEVANCYQEEDSVDKTLSYYAKEGQRLKSEREGTQLPCPPMSKRFPSLQVPASSGVAIGLDRLLMVLTGRRSIEEVLLFPFEGLLGEQVF